MAEDSTFLITEFKVWNSYVSNRDLDLSVYMTSNKYLMVLFHSFLQVTINFSVSGLRLFSVTRKIRPYIRFTVKGVH